MKTLFKIKTSKKYATRLEEHLVRIAKAWCAGKNTIELSTLDHFYNALQREKSLYCEDHRSARTTSVRILKTATSVSIGPNDPKAEPSATIELMTAEELAQDLAEVQDSLLIPLQS